MSIPPSRRICQFLKESQLAPSLLGFWGEEATLLFRRERGKSNSTMRRALALHALEPMPSLLPLLPPTLLAWKMGLAWVTMAVIGGSSASSHLLSLDIVRIWSPIAYNSLYPLE